MPKPVEPIVSATTPTPDPRVGLKAGRWDAAQAAWNMRMLSTTPPTGKVLGATHSDLAFSGNLAIMGNYNGFEIFDISNPTKPVLMQTYLCPASQNDVSVYRNLLFMSSEATNSRADCGFEGVPEPVSKLRVRGIRVFDIADVKHPKLVTTVQTCRGSHTHTVVPKLGDDTNVFIYVSGTAGVRSADEVPGCMDGGSDDPNTARFRLEVIKVPMKAPVTAAIVSSPRIFQGLPVPPKSEARDEQDRRDREQAQREAEARGDAAARTRTRQPGGANAERSQSVPRHHRLSGDRPRGRRVRGPRSAARHPRSGTSRPHRRGGRREHVVLALGDVQQRRHEDPLQRRVGRRRAAALPRDRQARVGLRRALHHRQQPQDEVPLRTTSCRRRRRRSRTASRTTGR